MLSERARVRPIALVGTAALCLALFGTNNPAAAQVAVETAFTYQGELSNGGVPVDEPLVGCDFEFTLWDADVDGNQVGPTLTPTALVADGRFIAALDFGDNIFTGEARFLEIAVCCPSPCGDFTTLSPRQELTPTPYSLHAPSAGFHNLASCWSPLLASQTRTFPVDKRAASTAITGQPYGGGSPPGGVTH